MAKVSNNAAQPEGHSALHLGAAPKPAIKVPSTKRFLYFCRPDRMVVMHDKVLPLFDSLIVEVGMNGVLSNGDPAQAITAHTAKGWTLLPPDIAGPDTTYIVRYTNNVGADVWLDQHAKVHNGSNRIGDGSKGFSEWVSSLIDEGKIEAPLDYIVSAHLAGIIKDASAIEDRDLKSEAHVLTTLRRHIAACERFLAVEPEEEEQPDAIPAKPKRRASK